MVLIEKSTSIKLFNIFCCLQLLSYIKGFTQMRHWSVRSYVRTTADTTGLLLQETTRTKL
jgi:hypothetical protein